MEYRDTQTGEEIMEPKRLERLRKKYKKRDPSPPREEEEGRVHPEEHNKILASRFLLAERRSKPSPTIDTATECGRPD